MNRQYVSSSNIRSIGYENDCKVAKCFEYGYIHVQYKDKDYRLAPEHIQIVNG